MPASPTPSQLRRLELTARSFSKKAYAPYSGFRVGAAVLTKSGKIFGGCNVENSALGISQCAERTAICTAVAAGERKIAAVAIYTPTRTPTSPCGACRQAINEFGADALVVSVCDSKQCLASAIADLLPAAFGPGDLKRAGR